MDVELKELDHSAVEQGYWSWMNDEDTVQYLESRYKAWSKEELIAYIDKVNASDVEHMFGIFYSNTYVGNIKLGPVNNNHKFASMGLMIGDKDYWGKGVATQAIDICTQFAFEDLKLNKVTAGCYADNVGSLKAFLKCGYQVEGTLQKHYLCNGQYVDALQLGKLNDN